MTDSQGDDYRRVVVVVWEDVILGLVVVRIFYHLQLADPRVILTVGGRVAYLVPQLKRFLSPGQIEENLPIVNCS